MKRNAVSMVTPELRRLGIIGNKRGLIEVVDREALNAIACECYDLIHKELGRLLTDEPSPECDD